MHASSPLLAKMPILRILVPFVAGIVMVQSFEIYLWWPAIVLLAAGCLAYLVLRLRGRTPAGAIAVRGYYIFALAAITMAIGWGCAMAHRPVTLNLDAVNGHPVSARIDDIRHKDFSSSLEVELQAGGSVSRPMTVLLTTRGCDYTLKPGDLIAFSANLSPITNKGNPDEFDYRKIMQRRGILYTQHLATDHIKRYGHKPTFLNRAANARAYVQRCVFNSRLSADAQKMLVAIILGNSTFIDQDTRQEFSCAGISHILALSGLHVGIVAGIIWLLLMPLDVVGAKKLRLVITLAVLVGFDVFTGLSDSVLRATVMIAFVFAAYVFNRRSVPLNALCGAALFILLFSPSSLYSAGFQLSFITVAALLIYSPRAGTFKSRSRFVAWLLTMTITSLISMLATLLLTAHYFHTMSFVSVLTNMLVLPVLPLIMALGVLLAVALPSGFSVPWLTTAFDWGHSYIVVVTSHITMLPGTHLSGVTVTAWEVAAFYAIVLLVTLSVKRKRLLWANVAIVVLAATIAANAYSEYTRKSGMLVLNDHSLTPLLVYDGDSAMVWFPDAIDSVSLQSFTRSYEGFLSRNRISHISVASNNRHENFWAGFVDSPYAFAMSRSFMAAGPGRWKTATNPHGISPDVMLVTKRYHGTIARLQELYHPRLMLLSGDIYEDTEAQLRRECDSLHVAYKSLRQSGAYIFD